LSKTTWLALSLAFLLALLVIAALYIHFTRQEGYRELYPSKVEELIREAKASLVVSVEGFSNGSAIPSKYTCDGPDLSPEVRISNIPDNAKSIALLVYDPDTPSGVFYHWLIYNIASRGRDITIPGGQPREVRVELGLQGINDFGEPGYRGPCPPPSHGKHRYVFLALALDSEVHLEGEDIPSILAYMKGHVIAYGVYVGLYER